MAGPETGKGKEKSRSRVDSPDVRPTTYSAAVGETTPRPGRPRDSALSSRRDFSSVGGANNSLVTRAARLVRLWSSEPVEAPQPKTILLFALIVALLALLRSILLPMGVPGTHPVSTATSVEQEHQLVRLVLAEELEGIIDKIEIEHKTFEELLARQTGALHEVQVLEKVLKASSLEIRELEGLGQAVQKDNSADAGLTTEVVRAQENLRGLHRSIAEALNGFKVQLKNQAETMRTVRAELSKLQDEAKGQQNQAQLLAEQAAAKADKGLESKLMDTLSEVGDFYALVKDRIEEMPVDVITASDLEELLRVESEMSTLQTSTETAADNDQYGAVIDHVRSLAETAVRRALLETDEQNDGGCLSKERFLTELGDAMYVLKVDGTGLRDFANVAVGGRVLTANGLSSSTYSPPSWWGSSRYWHGVGVENGIGPVDSVISEDTSLGACWAMSGDAGHVTIELSKEITVLAVAFEHVSRMVTPESFSAPAEFQVYGMRNSNDNFPVKLGRGLYDVKGRPIQTFDIEPLGRKFKYIQFRITTNWGNPDYTCIYRLRVHGK